MYGSMFVDIWKYKACSKRQKDIYDAVNPFKGLCIEYKENKQVMGRNTFHEYQT